MFVDYEGDKTRIYSTAGVGETFAEVLARRISRRGLVRSRPRLTLQPAHHWDDVDRYQRPGGGRGALADRRRP